MSAEKYTLTNATLYIDDVAKSIVDAEISIERGEIVVEESSHESVKKYAGSVDASASLNKMLITPELQALLLGESGDIETTSADALLAATDLDAGAREEITITSDPSVPTTVQATLTVGDVATTAGYIIISGTDSNDDPASELINFEAMSVGDASQVKSGTTTFKTTDNVLVSAGLEKGTVSYSTLKLDGLGGVKSIAVGDAETVDVKLKMVNGSNYVQIELGDCFFSSVTFPSGALNDVVRSAIAITVMDPAAIIVRWTP